MRKNEVGLAALLLVTTFGMHYLPSILATGYADKTAAAKALEYIASGVGGAVSFCILGILARSPLVWAVCFWAMVEGAEKSVCRLAKPIGGAPPSAAPFAGLCGQEFFFLGIFAALALALTLLDKQRGNDGNGP